MNCTAWPPTSTWSVSLFAHSAAASPPRCLWGRSRVRRARGGRHQLHGHLGADRCAPSDARLLLRSEEHTSELQSLMRLSYAVFCLKKKKTTTKDKHIIHHDYLHHTMSN